MNKQPELGTAAYARLTDKNLYHGDYVSTLCTCTGFHPCADGLYTGWSRISIGILDELYAAEPHGIVLSLAQLGADLGVTEGAISLAVKRLSNAGLLTRTRWGRRSIYRLRRNGWHTEACGQRWGHGQDSDVDPEVL